LLALCGRGWRACAGLRPRGGACGWRMRWCGRPLTSLLFGGTDPVLKSGAGSCP